MYNIFVCKGKDLQNDLQLQNGCKIFAAEMWDLFYKQTK
jgi:hypothetical protein